MTTTKAPQPYVNEPWCQRFRELVIKSELPYWKIAERIDSTVTNVGLMFNGKSRPSIRMTIRICKAFNCSADWLLGIKSEVYRG